MSRVAFSLSSMLLGGAICVGFSSDLGAALPDETKARDVAELAPVARHLEDAADLEMRFMQEDGPGSGHVRVVLTPESRPLTLMEARSAAEQGFLKTLDDPAAGHGLTQVTVVVRLMPGAVDEASAPEQTFRYLFKGGRDWAVLPQE
jgi:hypothetical protein